IVRAPGAGAHVAAVAHATPDAALVTVHRGLLGAGSVPTGFRVAAARVEPAHARLADICLGRARRYLVIATHRVGMGLAAGPGILARARRGAFVVRFADTVGVPALPVGTARDVDAAYAVLAARDFAADAVVRSTAVAGGRARALDGALIARFLGAGIVPDSGTALVVDVAHARSALGVVAARPLVAAAAVAAGGGGRSRGRRGLCRQRPARTAVDALDLSAGNAEGIPHHRTAGGILA